MAQKISVYEALARVQIERDMLVAAMLRLGKDIPQVRDLEPKSYHVARRVQIDWEKLAARTREQTSGIRRLLCI